MERVQDGAGGLRGVQWRVWEMQIAHVPMGSLEAIMLVLSETASSG